MLTIIGAIAELERSLIRERVMAGLRRAKLEGKHIGRPRLEIDREAVLEDRAQGMTLNEITRKHQVSKGSISRLLKKTSEQGVIKLVDFETAKQHTQLASALSRNDPPLLIRSDPRLIHN